MPKAFTVRHRSIAAAVLAAAVVLMPVRAHAASKEIIALQTQVQQLLDMVQRMQSTLDQKFGVLQHLVEQTADNANQMTQTVNSLQQKLNQQKAKQQRQQQQEQQKIQAQENQQAQQETQQLIDEGVPPDEAQAQAEQDAQANRKKKK